METLQVEMGNGLRAASCFASYGSKETPLLYRSELPTTACTLIFFSLFDQLMKCYVL
jgi:hypothetical protein